MADTSRGAGRSRHAAASIQTESKLAARSIGFSFEPNLEIDRIREVEGIQVRLSENRAPRTRVERYAEQMKRGAVFPAIVVNDRLELVDGNTRRMAARRIQRKTIPAYVCANLSAVEARLLSIELNQANGVAMTPEEIQAFVAGAVAEGQELDTRAYARMTGVRSSTLTRWVVAKRFQLRAVREGVEPARLEQLSDSVKAALNNAKLRAVFLAATDLAIEARVPSAELTRIVAEANAAPSEAEGLAVIGRTRAFKAEDVRAFAAGGGKARRGSAGAVPHIGGLLRFEVDDLLDVSRERQPQTFALMAAVRETLDETLARARTEWNLDPSEGRHPEDEARPEDLARTR